MKTIKPFIDLKWHTVPLRGELKRLSNGKKTIPIFPENWKATYKKEFNEDATALGGALTGEVSGIIAIDCDNTNTYEIFKALDPDYAAHFVSVGKKDGMGNDEKAGTIIYKYSPDLAESFRLHNSSVSLDFLSNDGFMYLPTEANDTKETISKIDIKEAPASVVALLKSIRPIKIIENNKELANKQYRVHLQPQVQRFVDTKKIIPELFKILTPKSFRQLPEYTKKGYLHPDDVPDGGGSDYLSKVSAILGADESIDVELYEKAMKTINMLFSQPMKTVRLLSTIVEPMAEEKASIDGKPIWQYNEKWQEGKLSLVTKRNNVIEAFFDPDRNYYYIADTINEQVKQFSKDHELVSFIEVVALESPSKKEIKGRLPLVSTVSTPAYPFGFFTNEANQQAFNSFSPTISLSIFKDPDSYKQQYTRPNTILQYLDTLLPDNYMRNYFLKFLRRKLDKFEYSPVIMYFLGVPGAGKDTLVNVIENLIGGQALARPTTKEFLELYNGWMLDKYFVQLDEYGDQLTRFDDKEIAKGKIKAYTGKEQVQIRQMRTDGYNYRHSITFIMTANKNPLYLEHDDRRIALFDCPNNLKNADWVHTAGGISAVIDKIYSEINDFAYYLATEVDNLSRDDYMTPPETEDKKILIAAKFSAAHRIAYLLGAGLFVEVEKLANEYETLSIFDGAPEGRIYEEELFDLYYEMTDGKGTKRGLNVAMKEFDKIPTTRNGQKSYYYNIPNLRGFKRTMFEPIEDTDVNINIGD